ncbi:hypothetical protein [Cryptosporangium minutisporangium]|uniref:DUF4232 domain-containing protein n=1 Tax=Cryptosporangium minutisporangium TaxID=113569 RepID=A0ABP6SXC0_9ACTN
MNWTVGPHPSSVYWRRRLLILGPLVIILLAFASCMISGGSGSDAARVVGVPSTTQASPAAGGGDSPDPGESGAGSADASPSQESPDSATAAPQAPAGGSKSSSAACADTALTLTAVPSDGSVRIGEFAAMRLVVKNSSSAACRRDVGSNEQELKILSGTAKVWSSDDCSSRADAAAATVDRKLVPGETLNYYIKWGGTTSSKNCVTGAPVKPGKYQLVARLGTLESKPVPFTVNP